MAITVSNQNFSWDGNQNADYLVSTDAGESDANTQRVVIASNQSTIAVDGSGVIQPVSGTVTANLSDTDNAVLDSIESNTTLSTSINSGSKSVTEAGTAETLVSSSTPCKKVVILADPGNASSEIYYGDSGVDSTTGMIVYSGQKEVIEIDDAQKIYLDVGTNGDSVRYIILA